MSVMNKGFTLMLGSMLLAAVVGCNDDKAKEAVAPALQSDSERFSYSVGVLMAKDMQNKGVKDIDEKAMGLAIRDVVDGKELRLTEEQMNAALELQAKKVMEQRNTEHKAKAAEAKLAGEKYLAENKTKEGVTALESGIQYKVLTEGTGAKPSVESTVVAHYKGSLLDGSVFDSSYDRGAPATFALNRVIPGWQEVLPLMAVGSKWQVVIPAELAYGEAGAPPRIGGNETLLFDIELVEIKQGE